MSRRAIGIVADLLQLHRSSRTVTNCSSLAKASQPFWIEFIR
jgi:hypothetical protein